MTDELPAITILMPSVEDFDGAVAAVRATGAHQVSGHHFEIVAPMSVAQVMALIRLYGWRDSGSDSSDFSIDFENEPEDDYALRESADAWYMQYGEYKPPCQECSRRGTQERYAAEQEQRKAEEIASRPARYGKPWTEEQYSEMLRLYASGVSPADIAIALGRTEDVIWRRLYDKGAVPYDDLPSTIEYRNRQ